MAEKRGVINPVPDRLRGLAKAQRSMQTRAEALFWTQIRAGRFHGRKFKRQVPIGPFIVDFLCTSARLVVELDGAPHDAPERQEADAHPTAWLRAQGFAVLRFQNEDVLGNCDRVLEQVLLAIAAHPLSRPAPQGTLSR